MLPEKSDLLPTVGISACLAGEAVRYDGRHKAAPALLRALAGRARLVLVCPEVEAGLGVPREPVELVQAGGRLAVRGRETGRDVTQPLLRAARARVRALAAAGLHGFILKSRSPSCGLRVPVLKGGRSPGVFARMLGARLPWLPVAEAETLAGPASRELFLVRAAFWARYENARRRGKRALAVWLREEELLLRAFHPEGAPKVLRAAANSSEGARRRLFGAVLRRRPTRRTHALALRRALSLAAPALPAEVRGRLRVELRAYRAGRRSRKAVAQALLRALPRGHALARQSYWGAFRGGSPADGPTGR